MKMIVKVMIFNPYIEAYNLCCSDWQQALPQSTSQKEQDSRELFQLRLRPLKQPQIIAVITDFNLAEGRWQGRPALGCGRSCRSKVLLVLLIPNHSKEILP